MGLNVSADLHSDEALAGVPGGVAGLQLLEAGNVPDAGDEDHWEDVDGAGVAADPVPG